MRARGRERERGEEEQESVWEKNEYAIDEQKKEGRSFFEKKRGQALHFPIEQGNEKRVRLLYSRHVLISLAAGFGGT